MLREVKTTLASRKKLSKINLRSGNSYKINIKYKIHDTVNGML